MKTYTLLTDFFNNGVLYGQFRPGSIAVNPMAFANVPGGAIRALAERSCRVTVEVNNSQITRFIKMDDIGMQTKRVDVGGMMRYQGLPGWESSQHYLENMALMRPAEQWADVFTLMLAGRIHLYYGIGPRVGEYYLTERGYGDVNAVVNQAHFQTGDMESIHTLIYKATNESENNFFTQYANSPDAVYSELMEKAIENAHRMRGI